MAAVIVARRRNYLTRERVFKDRLNPIDCLSDDELISRYRLSRVCMLDLLETITDELQHPTSRGHAISPIVQLTTALRFYATGCFQREVADLHGISMSSVSRCIASVSRAIAMKVKDYITFSTDPEELRKVKAGFFNKTGFPNVIGVIDGTLIPIKGPSDDEPLYVCRKGYHALNIQVVCDSELNLLNIVAKWPGSTHDSFMLNASELYTLLENIAVPGWLLGDSGYALKPWLLTPVIAAGTRPQQRYNSCHRRTRCVVERFNGVWKSRFRCLDRSGGSLQYSPPKCIMIIVATACLHQICNKNNLPLPELLDVNIDDNDGENDDDNPLDLHSGRAVRQQVIDNVFS